MLHTATNPICVLTRPDGELTSLYHSFFLLKVAHTPAHTMEVLWRVPERRARIDDIESGLEIFIHDILVLNNSNSSVPSSDMDMFGSFVITTSDGSRFFAYWRGSGDNIFVGVSKSAIGSFSRELFFLLQSELHSNIPQILLNFCETPMLPIANLEYVYQLSSGSTTLRFSKVELIEDIDVSLTGLTLMSPSMIVSAWEAILMERKLLVVSTNSVIIPACIEFLRRTVLPLNVINTYVPLLPEQLMGTIEAPFPYVLGANLDILRNSDIDTSETLILDLDSRSIVQPEKKENIARCPTEMREMLLKTLNDIILGSLTSWIQRSVPTDDERRANGGYVPAGPVSERGNPLSAASVHARATAVFDLFMRTNISLLTARRCRIAGFYRNPLKSTQRASNNGHVYKNGVTCGCMQMVTTRSSGQTQLIPCWFEMDIHCILIYHFADEIPLISIFFRNVLSVSPSHMEPDGHVFDINVKPQKHYGFAAIDTETRAKWIADISRVILHHRSKSQTPKPRPGGPGSGIVGNSPSSSIDGSSGVDLASLGETDELFLSADAELDEFRSNLLQTQMVSYLKSRLEFEEYEVVLNEIGLGSIALTEPASNAVPEVMSEPPTPFLSKLSPHSSDKDEIAICSLVDRWAAYVSDEGADDDLDADADPIRDTMRVRVPSEAEGDSPVVEQKKGYTKTIKSFFQRVAGSDAEERGSLSVSSDSLKSTAPRERQSMSSSKPSRLGRSSIVQEAMDAQRDRDKAVELAKVLAIQMVRSEIDDQHRLLEDELKTIVIQERTWRLKLLLGDKDALAKETKQVPPPTKKAPPITKASSSAVAAAPSTPTTDTKSTDAVDKEKKQKTTTPDATTTTTTTSTTATDAEVTGPTDVTGPGDVTGSADATGEGRAGARGANEFVERLRLYSEEKRDADRVQMQGRLRVLLTVYSLDDDLDCDNIAVDSSFSSSTVKSVEEGVWLKGVLEDFESGVPSEAGEDEDSFSPAGEDDATWGSTLRRWAKLGVKQSQSSRRRLNLTNSLHAYRKRLLLELKQQTEECHFEEGAYPLYSVLRTMMGYVYEQAMNNEQAVFAYSEGALMSQRRLMRNLVQKFANCNFPSKLGQNSNLIVKKPSDSVSICSAEYLETFLLWATGCGDIVKLQAFQFISELLHRRLSRLSGENMDTRGIMSRRTMSTTGISMTSSNAACESMVRTFSRPGGGGGGGISRAGSSPLTGGSGGGGRSGKTISRPDVLNEMYMCSEPCADACELTVILLTRLIEVVKLVCRNEYSSEEDQRTYDNNGSAFSLLRVRMRESVRNAIMNSEDFRLFEMMSCELQKVDVSGLDDDKKTLFFVNLFNIITGNIHMHIFLRELCLIILIILYILTLFFIMFCFCPIVHYVVSSGAPSPSLFDRYLFMRASKYNIGGMILNLMDVSRLFTVCPFLLLFYLRRSYLMNDICFSF
jgi:hypothetical protein